MGDFRWRWGPFGVLANQEVWPTGARHFGVLEVNDRIGSVPAAGPMNRLGRELLHSPPEDAASSEQHDGVREP